MAAGGAICFVWLLIVDTLIETSSCDDRRSISHIDAAHGQPARSPARPTNIDGGLEDIRWIHGLGGESLPAASYGILPNLKKKSIFCHSRPMEKFCLLICANQRPNVFLSYAWSAPAT